MKFLSHCDHRFIAATAAIAYCGPALADEHPAAVAQLPLPAEPAEPEEKTSNDFLTRDTMTGDWGGLRTRLHDHGFTIKSGYVGEYAYDASGGNSHGGGIAHQLSLGTDIDLSKAVGGVGTVHLMLNGRSGQSVSAKHVGNKLAVQEIYGAGENLRLAEMSYDVNFGNGRFNIKAGFYSMGGEFASTPILCSFMNTGFCSHSQSLPNNSGWSDYPTAKWGGRLRAKLQSDLYVEAGVYDVNPTYTLPGNGFKIGFSGSTGALFPFGIAKIVALGPDKLPGHYKLGGYYDTSSVPSTANAEERFSGRYGGYFLADQMVLSFGGSNKRGLILVADGTLSDRRTAPMPKYLLVAVIAQGPFASRPADTIGIGLIRASANRRTIDLHNPLLLDGGARSTNLPAGEGVVELSYTLQLTPWMLIHPNLQYIIDPGAFAFKKIPDAWITGLQTKLTF